MERIICLIIGYVFGLFQTGYFVGKAHHMDIRKHGSGNAGSTNALRVLGWGAGITTFIGDCFKCVLAILLVTFLFKDRCPQMLPLLRLYAGAGATLGHNFPFYMNFKGGKGIAATAGLLLSTTNWWMVLICLVAFVTIVAVTRYVSVGSLVVVILYFLEILYLGQTGAFGMDAAHVYELYGIVVFLSVLAFYKHRANIQRLLNGTENKLSVGKNK